VFALPLLPCRVDASTWSDLWQRPDQQAAHALQQGQAKQAQQLARDPAWRGAAAYRAGDFAAAARALQQAPGDNGAYNLGNALAKQGHYQQAIGAYDQALKLDPAHADAKANRKAVEDWMHRQQKQPQDQQPSDQQKQQGKNGSNGQSSSGEQGKDSKPDSQQAQDEKSAQDAADAAGNPDKDGQPQKRDQGKQGQQDQSGQDQTGQDRSVQDRAGQNQAANQPKPLTPQQQAEQKTRTEQAQQALQQQMDQALGGQQKTPPPATHQLGAMPKDDPQSKLPADIRQALQRVPDDPGALLRRKFELEYQQRHGGALNEEGQP